MPEAHPAVAHKPLAALARTQETESGCGCRVPASPPSKAPALLTVLAALYVLRRRRIAAWEVPFNAPEVEQLSDRAVSGAAVS